MVQAEFQHTHQAELTTTENRMADIQSELVKAHQRRLTQTLTAPIDGIVQQLAIHTIGGVVTPAQPLMVVVPTGQQLEAEVWVDNKDSGFVRAGQPCEVKVESFPFTIYGTLPCEVLSISSDAVSQENPPRLAYLARVRLHPTTDSLQGKIRSIGPGMNVVVEIKTDERRLLEYFLSPLLQALHESFRER